MQILINMNKKLYNHLIDNTVEFNTDDQYELEQAVRHGQVLPKGHGDLIDRDALIKSLGVSDRDIYCEAVLEEDAPTVIEADIESEEEE